MSARGGVPRRAAAIRRAVLRSLCPLSPKRGSLAGARGMAVRVLQGGCVKRILSPARGLYKLLNVDGSPCNGGRGSWPLPTNGRPGAWLEVKPPVEPCSHGLHLCRAKNLLKDWSGPALWLAEVHPQAEVIKESDKVVVSRARLLWRVETWNDQTLRLFAADCAERALTRAKVEDRRCWDAVTAARRYAFGLIDAAAGDVAGAAARAAAGAAAGDVAGAAAGDVAGAAARA